MNALYFSISHWTTVILKLLGPDNKSLLWRDATESNSCEDMDKNASCLNSECNLVNVNIR